MTLGRFFCARGAFRPSPVHNNLPYRACVALQRVQGSPLLTPVHKITITEPDMSPS